LLDEVSFVGAPLSLSTMTSVFSSSFSSRSVLRIAPTPSSTAASIASSVRLFSSVMLPNRSMYFAGGLSSGRWTAL
jgi:hypothetical protein